MKYVITYVGKTGEEMQIVGDVFHNEVVTSTAQHTVLSIFVCIIKSGFFCSTCEKGRSQPCRLLCFSYTEEWRNFQPCYYSWYKVSFNDGYCIFDQI